MEFEFCKLEIFLPESHLEAVQQALWSVDAGHIGRYDCCLSYSPVIGAWRPLAGTAPYLGRMGEVCHAPELKVEVTCRTDRVEETVAAVKRAPFWPNSASTGNLAGALSSYAGPSPRTRATNRATSAPGRS